MSVVVPPREFATTISAQAILRTGWVLASSYLLICAIIVIDVEVTGARPIRMVVPLGALLVMLLALVFLASKPSGPRGAVFLAIGSVAAFVFDYSLLASAPALNTEGTYLLTRVGIVLMLVGPVSRRIIDGVWWCSAGYLLGVASMATAQAILGLEFRPGWGMLVSLAIYLTLILTMVLIRWNRARFAPDFSAIELETARMAGHRELQEHAAALIHDTVLNDLGAVAHARGGFDERARVRLLRDISEVTTVTVELHDRSDGEADAQSKNFRNRLLALASDFQWRGLTVDIGGSSDAQLPVPDDTAEAVLGAVRSCLENVRKHSGVAAAEVVFERSAETMTVMVVDHGRGFDPTEVSADRLGLRSAVVGRVESCGGTVRVFSNIDSGTSVVMTVPLAAEHG